jgi:hypothetical protein
MKLALVAAATVIAAVASPAHASPTGSGEVIDAITAAGGSCSNVPLTHPVSIAAAGGVSGGAVHCDLQGVAFQVVLPGPDSESTRGAACAAGQISSNYQMLAGYANSWLAFSDHNRDLAMIASAIATHGVQAQIVNYCPDLPDWTGSR